MPRHHEQRILPYTADVLYEIVKDVKQYPQFLPWIVKAEIIQLTSSGFIADLTIGYNLFKDVYRSEVILTPCQSIDVNYLQGPFRYLKNHWGFSTKTDDTTEVDFLLDFEMKPTLFKGLVEKVFSTAVPHMVKAFEARAKFLGLQTAQGY
jgi:coenzyme Q-binding protein COQ10